MFIIISHQHYTFHIYHLAHYGLTENLMCFSLDPRYFELTTLYVQNQNMQSMCFF